MSLIASSPENSYKEEGTNLTKPVSRVTYSGENNEFVILNGKKYHRHELTTAFTGTVQVERYSTGPSHRFGNGAAAYGMAGFGIASIISGLYNCGVLGIKQHQMIIGPSYFAGGVALFLAEVWEMAQGNTFAAEAMTGFGCFWLSFGAVYTPSLGIAAAYGKDVEQFHNALGLWLVAWAIFAFMNLLLVLKSTWMFVALFVSIIMSFTCLGAGFMTGSAATTKAGGVFSVITGVCGFLIMFAAISTETNSYVVPSPMLVPLIGKNQIRGREPHLQHLMKDE